MHYLHFEWVKNG
uniref:Uncharacterized protein n=1 Tax=Zea mays TaxID=4577 RepID=C4J741_MAIZE|nr:unknown [Zea mays]